MSQLFEDGKIIIVDGVELECVSVLYRETDNERHDFVYEFRLFSEVEAERKAATDELSGVIEEINQPEEPKEETINVK